MLRKLFLELNRGPRHSPGLRLVGPVAALCALLTLGTSGLVSAQGVQPWQLDPQHLLIQEQPPAPADRGTAGGGTPGSGYWPRRGGRRPGG